jgi:Zn-dependent M16 (insulinase) family peptidase
MENFIQFIEKNNFTNEQFEISKILCLKNLLNTTFSHEESLNIMYNSINKEIKESLKITLLNCKKDDIKRVANVYLKGTPKYLTSDDLSILFIIFRSRS